MAEQKTKETKASVTKFLSTVKDEKKRRDCETISEMMRQVTKSEPHMWGTSIIGFGSYHYKYASGHEGDTCIVGFSPRKEAITLYLMGGLQHTDLLATLGKHKTGKGCLYIKDLADVNLSVLRKLISASVKEMKATASKLSGKK